MNPLPECSYRITPSLLNAYQRFLDLDVEDAWIQDADGGWHKNLSEATGELLVPPAEVEENALKELIDSINRVESVSEAACKGTALNAVVDWAVSGEKPDTDQMMVESDQEGDSVTVTIKKSREDKGAFSDDNVFRFRFVRSWVASVARYFKDALCQIEVHAPMDTKYGRVELYGFPDFVRGDIVHDLKTTKNYTFGDHAKGWQKSVYPYCLIESGMMTDVRYFEYSVFKWAGGTKTSPNLSGVFYPEVYTYDHDSNKVHLRQMCERFIEFLEAHRDEITDRKVFGGLEH